MTDHLLYALAWILFGLSHSGLAALGVKARLERVLGRWYRLAYNLVAVAAFALVVWVGAETLGARPVFGLPGWALVILGAIHVAGWVVLVVSARYYDLGRLAGTAQLRDPRTPEDEVLRLDGPHAYVRHPLYAGAYLILWGAAVSPLGLSTALWGSLYLAAGTWFEERKLTRLYGQAYDDYRSKVPALLPWRGRAV